MNHLDFAINVDLAIRYAEREAASLRFLRDRAEVFTRYVAEGLETVGLRNDPQMAALAYKISEEYANSRWLKQAADQALLGQILERMWVLQSELERVSK